MADPESPDVDSAVDGAVPEKDLLRDYLYTARDALRWKVEGLGELDARRSLTPTGLSLLGLVHHTAVCACEYFGVVFDRPFPEPTPDVDADPHADFVVPAEVSLEEALGYVDRAWAHADATIDALDLDATGVVPWWTAPRDVVTLRRVLVHMIAEAHRHAGHADVLRERLDGLAGLRPDATNLPDDVTWQDHVARVDAVAHDAAARHDAT
ncbi:DinB family protein [Aeromicrobium sp. CnD17-E]|uniref:DinB family protein n=1 Tax=Aeromicrobium sp. CnD17-E TaxID=2954487 RepID=UPI002096C5A7|nr:DinB family protein [Aeromicrobium sp. CnD17-E]MCO7238784.1 DinB family protein [Aeromicrobium sp. CnD17-E]